MFSEATGRKPRSDIPAEVKDRQRSTVFFPGSFNGWEEMYVWVLLNSSVILVPVLPVHDTGEQKAWVIAMCQSLDLFCKVCFSRSRIFW